jgi:hypothetical protein
MSDLWDFCHSRQIFSSGHIAGLVFCSNVAKLQQAEEAANCLQRVVSASAAHSSLQRSFSVGWRRAEALAGVSAVKRFGSSKAI